MRAADIALKKCPYTPPPKKKKYPVTVMPCHTSSHVNTHTCAEYKYMCICVDTFAEYNTHTYTHTQTDRGGRGSRTCARIAPAHTVDAPCTQQCGPAAGAHGASRPAGAPRGPRTAHVCVCVCVCASWNPQCTWAYVLVVQCTWAYVLGGFAHSRAPACYHGMVGYHTHAPAGCAAQAGEETRPTRPPRGAAAGPRPTNRSHI